MRKLIGIITLLSCIVLFAGCNAFVPDPPEGLTGISCSASGVSDGKITGVDSSMEYRSESSESYIEIASDTVTGLSAGKYYVRYKKTDEHFMSDDVEVLVSEPSVYASADAVVAGPNVKAVNCTSYGANNGKIQNVDSTMEYSVDGGNSYLQISSNEITGLEPGTYYVRYKDPQSVDSSVTVMQPANKPVAPASVNVTKTSVTLKYVDGCEYSIDGVNWQSDTTFEDLKPGKKYVFYQRVKASGTTLESESSAAEIKTVENYNKNYETPSYSNDSSEYLVFMSGESEINVRRGPGASYYIETSVAVWDTYNASAYKIVNGTKWVYFPSLNGWISSNCLVELQYNSYTGYVVNIDDDSYLIMRDSPSYSSKEIGKIPYDEYGLPIYNTSGEFYLTYYKNKFCWISKKYIKLENY